MKKNIFKFICILFISIICFCTFNSNVRALNCKVYERTEYIISVSIDDGEKTDVASIELDPTTLKVKNLIACRTKISNGEIVKENGKEVSLKKGFDCDIPGGAYVSFGAVDMTKKFYKFTNNVSCEYDGYSTIKITGLKNMPDDVSDDDAQEAVMCKYDDFKGKHSFLVVNQGQDNQDECYITIQQDNKDGDVIMKHGDQTTINPKNKRYVCKTVTGDSIDFYINRNMPKGSLKSTDDCPTITRGKLKDSSDDNGHATVTIDNIFDVTSGKLTCESALRNTLPILKDIFKYMRLGAVILFIVLTSMDYVKSIASSDQTMFKKANDKVLKRTIALIVVLMLPSLINLILAIIQLEGGTCGIK